MEPIRPERDEVRGTKKPVQASTEKKAGGGDKPAPAKRKHANGEKRPGGGSSILLVILLLAVALGGGWALYNQSQRIDELSTQLQDAEHWANQSKLMLARVEGQISETGETLEKRGSTQQEKIANLTEQAKTADSEIRKLWAIANERNRDAIKANAGELAEMKKTVTGAATALAALEKAQSGQKQSQAELKTSIESVSSSVKALEPRIVQVQQATEKVQEGIDQRLDRFAREQGLARQELQARIGRLESTSSGTDNLKANLAETRQRLDKVDRAIDAIDASRAQLNSRLINLDKKVDGLATPAR
ncbi:hypothetical protein ACTXGQ_12635 [Marinobacter sp. 1Y8]